VQPNSEVDRAETATGVFSQLLACRNWTNSNFHFHRGWSESSYAQDLLTIVLDHWERCIKPRLNVCKIGMDCSSHMAMDLLISLSTCSSHMACYNFPTRPAKWGSNYAVCSQPVPQWNFWIQCGPQVWKFTQPRMQSKTEFGVQQVCSPALTFSLGHTVFEKPQTAGKCVPAAGLLFSATHISRATIELESKIKTTRKTHLSAYFLFKHQNKCKTHVWDLFMRFASK